MLILKDIVKESSCSGVFPAVLERSLVRRVLKKPDLDKHVLKNCRPVANIPLMAEVIEKAVAAQTHFYLETNH